MKDVCAELVVMCKRLLHFVFAAVSAVTKCESGRAIFLPPVRWEGKKLLC
jgi:hypothetical protein